MADISHRSDFPLFKTIISVLAGGLMARIELQVYQFKYVAELHYIS